MPWRWFASRKCDSHESRGPQPPPAEARYSHSLRREPRRLRTPIDDKAATR